MKNKLLLLLLGLLGFACNSNDEPGEAMYGTPNARFTIKGRVKNAAGNPVAGIRVTPLDARGQKEISGTQPFQAGSPVYTNATGEYEVFGTCFDWDSFFVTLRMEDVDGEKNGLFDPKQTDVGITPADRTASGQWTSDYTKQAGDTILEEAEK